MNRYPLFSKTLMIGFLALLLLIPLMMIESKISERHGLQQSVQQQIESNSATAQTLAGPFLVISYKTLERHSYKDEKGAEKVNVVESGVLQTMFSPRNVKIEGDASVETRNRGIYPARLFNLHSKVSGSFEIPRAYGINHKLEDIVPVAAYFVVKVSDARGIRNVPILSLNSVRHDFAPGSVQPVGGNGIHVPLSAFSASESHVLDFSFPLDLQGSRSLAMQPNAKNTQMSLKSSWPHPSFGGGFLPASREVTPEGFKAEWLVTDLARNTANQSDSNETFSVDFINPVDVYLLSERAVKYGVMFVVLVFTAFFMFEVLRGLAIHPMQYLLVGLAMAMFFLLIISLSEHISFIAAYSASATACIALIGIYLGGVLKSYKPALLFSGGISLLYAVLYGVLQSEDNALLMGSVVLFTALAVVMLLTRKMDWYGLQQG